jgi:hypothetical protein
MCLVVQDIIRRSLAIVAFTLPLLGTNRKRLSLLYLAPDLQEALLFLPPTLRGRDPIILADVQPIAAALDWRKQRRLWRRLVSD